MKKILFVLFALLAVRGLSQTEVISQSPSYTSYWIEITLDSTDTEMIWVPYPAIGGLYYSPSTTKPTYANATMLTANSWHSLINIGVSIQIDSIGSADESDSLTVELIPFDYFRTTIEHSSGTIDTVSNIQSYVKFSDGTLAATSQNFNWVDGRKYGFSIAGETKYFRGFAIKIRQIANDVADVLTRIRFQINIPR